MSELAKQLYAASGSETIHSELLAEAADRIEELEVEQWQPIESAPKDDTETILLLCADGRVSAAYWDAYYAEGGRGYQDGMLAWIEPCSAEQVDLHYDPPTHWMPLPEPPQEQDNE